MLNMYQMVQNVQLSQTDRQTETYPHTQIKH